MFQKLLQRKSQKPSQKLSPIPQIPPPVFPNSTIITVPGDYSSIGLAVNASKEGDTILVNEGVYYESVTVDKTLTIRGENRETTIVDGNNLGPTFLIRAKYVRLTGFTVRNVLDGPAVGSSRGRYAGMHLLHAYGCIVSENTVTHCGKGVWVYGGSGNTIANNSLLENNYGVLATASTDSFVVGNSAANGWGGIWLENCQRFQLRNNLIDNNARSFTVSGSEISYFLNDVDTSNAVNSRKIYYLFNSQGITVDPASFPDLGSLILVNCNDVTVKNLDLGGAGSIRLAGALNTTISNNVVSGNSLGVCVQFGSGCVVSSNIISDNDDGIYVQSSVDCVISGNTLKRNLNSGITIESSNETSVVGNDVRQDEFESRIIAVLNSHNDTIAENTIGDGGLAVAIWMEYSNYINITNNSQSKTSDTIYGIELRGSSNNLIQSNVLGNCVPGVWILAESNYNLIVGNKFSTDRGTMGVDLSQSYFNNLSDNTVNNFSTGLQLSNAENNTIAHNTVTSREHAMELFRFNNNTFEGNKLFGATDVWDTGTLVKGEPSVNTWK